MISVFDKKEDCCGCTACKHICPTHAIGMVSDQEGFLYPEIDQKLCIDCGLCKKVCAFQNGYDVSRNFTILEVYAVKHKKEDVRMSSTSGGVFTAISDFVLKNEGVIFGVAFDENMNAIHKAANTSDERDMFKGSKYVQSNLKDIYKEIKELLNEGRQVLFTGTPCQTAGLKSFLAKDNTEKLILCDIVCHGVPSPLMWREHINHLEENKKSKVLSYNFRDKLIGWRGANITIKLTDKMHKNNSLARTYTNLYFSHNILRPACHFCKYTNMERPSDITIADFWGIEKHMPEFDDNKGISLVLINSAKGKEVFEKIKNELFIRRSNEKDCLQPQLREPSKPSPNRVEFWKEYETYGYEYVIKKYGGYNLKNVCKITSKNILDKIGLLNIIRKVRKAR